MPSFGPVNKLLVAEGATVVEKSLLAKSGTLVLADALKVETATGGKLVKTLLATEDAIKLSPKYGTIGKNAGYIPKAGKFAELKAEVLGNPAIRPGRHGLHQYIRIRVLEVVGQAKAGAATGKAVGGVGGVLKEGAAVGKGGVTGGIQAGTTLTISHNITVGAKVPVAAGDVIHIKGMPFSNPSGNITGLHWTHHARTPNDAGWIKAVVGGVATRFQ